MFKWDLRTAGHHRGRCFDGLIPGGDDPRVAGSKRKNAYPVLTMNSFRLSNEQHRHLPYFPGRSMKQKKWPQRDVEKVQAVTSIARFYTFLSLG